MKNIVFICHTSPDKDTAREIAMFLVAEGVGVWFDEWAVAAGDSIVEEIEKGLSRCTHFLVLWSANAETSNWVRQELQSTLAEAISSPRKRVIPIRLDDTPLPPLIRGLKYLRYRDGSESERMAIVDAVVGHAPSQNFIRAVVKKYHEVIGFGSSEGPRACPQCGSTHLKFSEWSDEQSYRVDVSCKECKWGELLV